MFAFLKEDKDLKDVTLVCENGQCPLSAVLGYTWLYWAVLESSGLYQAVLESTGQYWAVFRWAGGPSCQT